jgi:hypothetical protein
VNFKNGSLKGLYDRIYKTTFSIESYLVNLPRIFRTGLIKFRTTNHHFSVETAKWSSSPWNERQKTGLEFGPFP